MALAQIFKLKAEGENEVLVKCYHKPVTVCSIMQLYTQISSIELLNRDRHPTLGGMARLQPTPSVTPEWTRCRLVNYAKGGCSCCSYKICSKCASKYEVLLKIKSKADTLNQSLIDSDHDSA